MNTKLLMIAASTLALAACGGSDVETAAEENDLTNGPVETALSEEQPTLEGDSPFVDGEDVADSRLDQESYDTGLDGPDLGRDDELADFDTDTDFDADRSIDALVTESERLAADTRDGVAAMGDRAETAARDTMASAEQAARDVAAPVTDGVSAKQYTANNTDARIGPDGELITGSEAALLAGTYDVALPGQAGTKTLYITGEGDTAVGTFDGEPIEVTVTGRNFSFDAPVEMDGAEELMTFAGTFEDGVIDNGVLESQGDGTTMTFTAVRTDANTSLGARDMLDDAEAGADRVMDSGEGLLDETGDALEGAYEGTTDAVGNAYDRATDGTDRTNVLGTDRGDGDVDLDIDEDLNDDMDMDEDPNFDM